MNPRASASFCHCPKLISAPSGQVTPSCVSIPEASCSTRFTRAGTIDGGRYGHHIVEARQVADTHGVARPELKTGKAMCARSTPSTRMRPLVG
jgi:hypothetical protein